MKPPYLFMLAVLLGPFGCDSDPARGPKPEAAAVSAAPASTGSDAPVQQPVPGAAASPSA